MRGPGVLLCWLSDVSSSSAFVLIFFFVVLGLLVYFLLSFLFCLEFCRSWKWGGGVKRDLWGRKGLLDCGVAPHCDARHRWCPINVQWLWIDSFYLSIDCWSSHGSAAAPMGIRSGVHDASELAVFYKDGRRILLEHCVNLICTSEPQFVWICLKW